VGPITESVVIALAGLVAVVALLFLLITRFTWHVFLALLLLILLFAAVPGIDKEAYIEAFEVGFGRTIQGIAVVILLGSVLAETLKPTGGVERITGTMIRWVGERRMPLALKLSGFVIGIASTSLSRMSLKAPLISYGGVTLVNGVVAMAAIYVMWAVGWL
jgi:GntP family gluconate:H+ symporter